MSKLETGCGKTVVSPLRFAMILVGFEISFVLLDTKDTEIFEQSQKIAALEDKISKWTPVFLDVLSVVQQGDAEHRPIVQSGAGLAESLILHRVYSVAQETTANAKPNPLAMSIPK